MLEALLVFACVVWPIVTFYAGRYSQRLDDRRRSF